MRSQGRYEDSEGSAFNERVVSISRVSKVVKGGRHLSFSAMVVVGDGEGQVGVGKGKADLVPDAVRKGVVDARKNMIFVPIKGGTIPHEVIGRFGASEVMLKPAPTGTGVIAGGAVRAVVELVGVKDIVTKARRSTNAINTVKAAFKGLSMLKDIELEMASRKTLLGYPDGKQSDTSQGDE